MNLQRNGAVGFIGWLGGTPPQFALSLVVRLPIFCLNWRSWASTSARAKLAGRISRRVGGRRWIRTIGGNELREQRGARRRPRRPTVQGHD
jgi:hypothetical protein